MRRTGTLAILIGVLVLTVAVAWAGKPGAKGDAAACQNAQCKAKLGLTDAQAADLQKECTAFHDRRAAARGQTAGEWKALNGLLAADKVDDAAVQQQVQKIAALESDEVKAKADHLLAVRKILTADQFKRFSEMFMEKSMEHGHGRGHCSHGEGKCPKSK